MIKIIEGNTKVEYPIELGGDYEFRENIYNGLFRREIERNGYPFAIRAWKKLFLYLIIANYIFKNIKEKNEIKILDAGCGNCFLLEVLENNFVEYEKKKIYYYGIDLKDSAIRNSYEGLKDKIRKIDAILYHHNLLNGLPFENNSIDFIVCLEVIKYWKKEDVIKFLKETNRVLKENGIMFLSTQGIFDRKYNIGEYLEKYKEKGILNAFSFDEFIDILRNNNFKEIKILSTEGRILEKYINLFPELFEIFPEEILESIFGFFDKDSHSKLFILKKITI